MLHALRIPPGRAQYRDSQAPLPSSTAVARRRRQASRRSPPAISRTNRRARPSSPPQTLARARTPELDHGASSVEKSFITAFIAVMPTSRTHLLQRARRSVNGALGALRDGASSLRRFSSNSISNSSSALSLKARCQRLRRRRCRLVSFTSSSDSCCFVFWSMTVLTSAAIWSSFRPSAESSSLSTALPFSMPHMIAARCAAAWLFASTVCWPRSWIKPSIFSNALRLQRELLEVQRRAELVAELAEPLVEETEPPRVERAGARERALLRELLEKLRRLVGAWPMAVTVRATASTCPVKGPCVALTTSWAYGRTPAELQEVRGLLDAERLGAPRGPVRLRRAQTASNTC